MPLYAVLLGGSAGPGRFSEDHETVFVVAESEKDAKLAARAKWSGFGRPHVDALEALSVVDGHEILLRPGASQVGADLVSYNDEPFDDDKGES